MVMVPVMGITWIFGVVSVNQETMVFQFIFAILNSFQVILYLQIITYINHISIILQEKSFIKKKKHSFYQYEIVCIIN